jgi:hypothetical protein
MKVFDYDRSKNQMLLRAIFFSLQLWTPHLTNVKLAISFSKYIYFFSVYAVNFHYDEYIPTLAQAS